jgi:hypothetical protein
MTGKINLETKTIKYMSQPIKTFSFSQEEILENILSLYTKNKRIDVDATYSIGNFYKSGRIQQPVLKYDINLQLPDVLQGRSSLLPIDDNKIGCVSFDPPFLININGNNSELKMVKRFSCYISMSELKIDYLKSLQEFHRILKIGGIAIFKCQDLTYAGKNHMISDWIVTTAEKLGLEPIDKFILLSNKRIINPGIQRHARKYHSYFLVFRKTRTPNNKKVSGIQRVLRIKPTTNYKSKIFNEAWLIAKLEALRNGGSSRDHISQGLKMAWRNYKEQDRVDFRIAA